MLYWLNLFIFILVISFVSLFAASFSLWSLLLQSEFILMVLFMLLCVGGLVLNVSYLLGLAFVLLILSGLEISIGFLLLVL